MRLKIVKDTICRLLNTILSNIFGNQYSHFLIGEGFPEGINI